MYATLGHYESDLVNLMGDFSKGSSSEFAKAQLRNSDKYVVEGPSLGPVNRATLVRDPKHLGFTLARYKFISKMFKDMDAVYEVGCNEGTGTLVLAPEVKEITALDFDLDHISFCKSEYANYHKNIKWIAADALDGIPPTKSGLEKYDGGFLLDVLEHIEKSTEKKLLRALSKSLKKNGTLIVGIPSIESQPYASPVSKVQHINCKSMYELRDLMKEFFHNVYMFGMNDEMLHVGYHHMCQYIFAMGVNPKAN